MQEKQGVTTEKDGSRGVVGMSCASYPIRYAYWERPLRNPSSQSEAGFRLFWGTAKHVTLFIGSDFGYCAAKAQSSECLRQRWTGKESLNINNFYRKGKTFPH